MTTHSETYYKLHDERGDLCHIKLKRASQLIGMRGYYTEAGDMAEVNASILDVTDQIRLLEAIEDGTPEPVDVEAAAMTLRALEAQEEADRQDIISFARGY